jgi:hypothetical protein
MRIDNRTVENARNADMVGFFRTHCGYTFDTLRNAYRCKEHPSLAVNADRHAWFWHSMDKGGYGPIDYLISIENMPFRKAVETITDAKLITLPKLYDTEQAPALLLPEKREIPLRLYDYLCEKRGIDGWIVAKLIQEEKLYEDRRGNVVFVGYDENNEPRFASVRGSFDGQPFRGDCLGSDKRYSFNMPFTHSEQLYIFESPIDAMSHGSIDNCFRRNKDAWKRISRLSLAGTTDIALPTYLQMYPQTKELVFCLDNDPAGLEAANVMSSKYSGKGYNVRIEPPYGKDFNIDLIAKLKMINSGRQKSRADISL